jgi:hypothetical protein
MRHVTARRNPLMLKNARVAAGNGHASAALGVDILAGLNLPFYEI